MSSARARRVAYVPRLDLAIRSGGVYLFRGRSVNRPVILTERAHSDIAISKFDINQVNSASFSWQSQGDQSSTSDNFPTGL